jgi:hypothetical protein
MGSYNHPTPATVPVTGPSAASVLDRLIPAPRLVEVSHVDLAAPPDAVWQRVRHGDLASSGPVRALFALRELPRRMTGARVVPPALRIDGLHSSEECPGFRVLIDEPPREVAVGAIGKVWRPNIPFVHTATAEDYARFDAPGFVKVAWSLRVRPQGDVGSRLEVEVRVDATDGASWRKFRRYFRVVGMGSRFIRRSALAVLARELGRAPRDRWSDVVSGLGGAGIMVAALATSFLRRRRSHWGLTTEEAERTYPGDGLVAHPRWSWTHGIQVDAPAETVWPWVAQMGADRGGFYSYQWLENIAQCEIRNADRVHPEWQLREGDTLSLGPKAPSLEVVEVVPGRYLVAHDASPRAEGRPWVEVSWLFFIEPLGPTRCRVISRYRCATSADLKTRLTLGPTFLEPIGFAMDRRMLKGLKERAE